MIQTTQATTDTLPRSLDEFLAWEPNDGFKYEWNDGEIIQFAGMQENQINIYVNLLDLLIELGYAKTGTLIAEHNVHVSGIQLRRPDIAYFTREQVRHSAQGGRSIPDFLVEVISTHDKLNRVEKKLTEYFEAGVKVVWVVIPEERVVNVYTSRREVKACIEDDLCSAAPVLPDFEISVNEMLALEV